MTSNATTSNNATGSNPGRQRSSGAQASPPNNLTLGASSVVFQQVKQTQASLARLSRVHQQQQQQQQQQQSTSQTNQSSPIAVGSSHNSNSNTSKEPNIHQLAPKSTTFVDCLIRRFKDCFSEDFCTVPMFVVGNLSPGSDGTHLILPPCVSLGRQQIGRFASLKNMRLMNSIRESCRSIEELDLGGNKLHDLIEVYKILQCTPNLKFLNLSENDLSRSSPVAMAYSPSSTSTTISSSPPTAAVSSSPHHWPSSAITTNTAGSTLTLSQRSCLAPINQNQQHQQRQQAMATRRHSTLGTQPIMSNLSATSTTKNAANQASRLRTATSRVAEARRMAAAAAVAQSRKTSSSLASKLARSAAITSEHSDSSGSIKLQSSVGVTTGSQRQNSTKVASKFAHQRHPTVSPSTMHLARSLSSLSAKEVRASTSLSNRLTARTCSTRKDCVRSTVSNAGPSTGSEHRRLTGVVGSTKSSSDVSLAASNHTAVTKVGGSGVKSADRLFVEPPIVETMDDVDMGEHQQQQLAILPAQQSTPKASPSTLNQQTSTGSNNSNNGLSVTSRSSAMNTPTFGTSSQSSPNHRRTFESIKALALNNTGCQWRVVCSILSRMPNLEELHLSLNNYERIDLDPNEFKHLALKRLYLCNNPKLTNWQELDKLLIAFPSLEALSIADCNISQIPENLDRAREWRKLCGLNINGWPIKEWPIIERLNQLPSLIDLKCRNLEILQTIDEPRHHLIARLPKLQRLNGSEIEEREHAEKAFLRFFMANTHLERPSRFHELVQIHGEIIPVDVDVDLSPPSHAQVRVIYLDRHHYRKENEDDIFMSEDFLSKLMDSVGDQPTDNSVVQLNNHENMETDNNLVAANQQPVIGDMLQGTKKAVRLFKDPGQEVLAIEIDLRQSVRKFKSTLASLFGLDSQDVILYYIDHEMVGLMGPELIKHNQKKLWNYNVQDGDQFIVEER